MSGDRPLSVTPSRKQRYERLSSSDLVETLQEDVLDDFQLQSSPATGDGVETESLVTEDHSQSTSSMVFRSNSSYADDDNDDGDGMYETDSAGGIMHESIHSTMKIDDFTVPKMTISSISPSQRSAGRHSRSSSFGDAWDEDDEAGLRRYNLNVNVHDSHLGFGLHHQQQSNQIPRSGSESSSGQDNSFVFSPKRLWLSFLELRAAARQRTAARLLRMPSESFYFRLQACLMNWFCDATDRGILLAAGLLLIWLGVGIAANIPGNSNWWRWGLLLFFVRVSARHLYECTARDGQRCSVSMARRRRQRVRGSDLNAGPSAAAITAAVAASNNLSSSNEVGDGDGVWRGPSSNNGASNMEMV